MSTPTTARGALLRRAGTLLVAAALVGAPASAAFADPTASPTTTSTSVDTAPTAPAPASPSPSDTASGGATPSADSSVTPTQSPTDPATSPSPSDPAPSPSDTTSPSVPAPSASPSASPPASPSSTTLTRLLPGGRTTALGPNAAAGPATSSDPALLAAHYLQQQLAATGYLLQSSGFPDPGLTADAILALDAAGTGQTAAAAATQKLVDDPVGYTGFGDPTEVYAGSVAKLLNIAVAQGIDPGAFGGFDVLGTLQGLETPNGRFSDVSAFGDFSNTFGQSFALIGLHRAGAPVSADALGYLLAQQCPGGGFKLFMDDAGCTTDADADPDATAMAVQALFAVGGAATEAGDGLGYLASVQGASGGVSSPTQGVNANTTGLAGQAFLAGGRTAQARAAVSFLTDLQYSCDFAPSIRGGVAYDQAAYDDQKAAGSKASPVDIDRRSTAQALLALAGTPLAMVTATGADAVAPTPACTSTGPTTTPTSTPSTSTRPTSGGGSTQGAGGSGGSDPSTTVDAAAATGSLAQTGTDVLAPVLLGLMLVLVGGLAVWFSTRRRGAHA
jgi:LPXTG-motif cell wall-anchored protein